MTVRRRAGLLAVVAAIAAVVLVVVLAGGDDDPGRAPAVAAAGCPEPPGRGPLPVWARTGFSDDGSGIPHVIGRRGTIAAVLFGWPLSSPPAKDRGNKVLWVPRRTPQGPAPLRIAAHRIRPPGPTVTRRLESGPGPSYVDLPTRGCWRLRLRWGHSRDTVDLPYT